MPRQPYHLVEPSPWPIIASFSAFCLALGLIGWFHFSAPLGVAIGIPTMGMAAFQWWRDVAREATLLGHHSSQVSRGLKIGMLLFIISEVMFFFGFFWAFFHNSLAPTPEIGCTWPPTGITPLNPFSIPLLNTAVLLGSGVSVTWAHHALLSNDQKDSTYALMTTIILGAYFTSLQLNEYLHATFSISDGIYGTTFFVATGFHGLHVLIGTSFLLVCLIRLIFNQFSQDRHFGFEAAAWYWHFVDVVWIFLYLSIYWWGT